MHNPKLANALLLGFATIGPLHAGDCEPDDRQRAMLDRVNEARSEARQCGDEEFEAAEPLAWSCRLEEASEAHSRDMAENEFFSHADADDVGVNDRVSDTGYDWMAVGENIAAGQADVATVIEGWLSSPGHCANIMNDEFTEMGAAVVEAQGSDYSPYWTQVFARPR
ncbi:CAP domain-containing protein [Halomonas alkalisoli]|uniref:CAP domain-containing protein n=1 Tax=Halomonas alkalisoli TaxID=2907158 RepID=UPI001F32B92F|nr:CAP domain-containing protein [Halomonas alkalisoli]MCE9684316.1 CAP domain-containing protein [Halomonas alkalisoli]